MRFLNFSICIMMLLFLFPFLSCNENDGPSYEKIRTLQDIGNDFSNVEFEEGINDIELEGLYRNTVWRFRVILPEGSSEMNKRPLVVCLHGAARIVDPDLHKHTACLEEPGLSDLKPILLCPNSEGFGWFDFPEREKIVSLTNFATEHLPVAKDKIAIMGYSDGGNGAWFYAQYFPEVFTAAIALASSYNPKRIDLPSAKIDIPLYVIHGENDQLFLLTKTQEMVDLAIDAGTSVEFVIAEDLEHYNSCAYVPYLKDAAIWLQTVVWNN